MTTVLGVGLCVSVFTYVCVLVCLCVCVHVYSISGAVFRNGIFQKEFGVYNAASSM